MIFTLLFHKQVLSIKGSDSLQNEILQCDRSNESSSATILLMGSIVFQYLAALKMERFKKEELLKVGCTINAKLTFTDVYIVNDKKNQDFELGISRAALGSDNNYFDLLNFKTIVLQ